VERKKFALDWIILTIAPPAATLGRMARHVWSGALCSMVRFLTDDYPDQDVRTEMANKLKADIFNPDYHLYAPMYSVHLFIAINVGTW